MSFERRVAAGCELEPTLIPQKMPVFHVTAFKSRLVQWTHHFLMMSSHLAAYSRTLPESS